jgi:hypothetical protein
VKSRVYNIGTGVGVTLRDFERVIKKHIPNAQMEIGGGLNFYGFAYPATGVYDISRAARSWVIGRSSTWSAASPIICGAQADEGRS